jgi:hypothetical protein
MTKFLNSAMLPLLFAGMCAAQNARPVALPIAAAQRNSVVAARLQSSDTERFQWEASQLFAPLGLPGEHGIACRPIHIQLNNPAALSLPKLRPEWLRPSTQLDLSTTDMR